MYFVTVIIIIVVFIRKVFKNFEKTNKVPTTLTGNTFKYEKPVLF